MLYIPCLFVIVDQVGQCVTAKSHTHTYTHTHTHTHTHVYMCIHLFSGLCIVCTPSSISYLFSLLIIFTCSEIIHNYISLKIDSIII